MTLDNYTLLFENERPEEKETCARHKPEARS